MRASWGAPDCDAIHQSFLVQLSFWNISTRYVKSTILPRCKNIFFCICLISKKQIHKHHLCQNRRGCDLQTWVSSQPNDNKLFNYEAGCKFENHFEDEKGFPGVLSLGSLMSELFGLSFRENADSKVSTFFKLSFQRKINCLIVNGYWKRKRTKWKGKCLRMTANTKEAAQETINWNGSTSSFAISLCFLSYLNNKILWQVTLTCSYF